MNVSNTRAGAPTVGMVLAFTGHYRSVRIMADFLRRAGVNLVVSEHTSPSLLETAATVASADFCLPLRAYVGHVQKLIADHPDLDFIVAPNVLAEDGLTSTCSKYRDVGGVVIRSLGDTLGYQLKFAPPEWKQHLSTHLGEEAVEEALARSGRLPRILQPTIESAEERSLFYVCLDVYRELFGLRRSSKYALLLDRLGGVGQRWVPWVDELRRHFAVAYAAHDPDRATRHYHALWEHPERPRLALIGRRYLLNDDTLSADLRRYFLRRGVNVITALDVPFSDLRPHYEKVDGFYDTHREGEALVEWALPHVDGFISVGSFGCHPDAFQVETLAERARRTGKPVWTFRYDETVGNAGFQTRYETILTFLEQERDRRQAGSYESDAGEGEPGKRGSTNSPRRLSGRPRQTTAFAPAETPGERPTTHNRKRKPLIIWPTMGEVLDLLIQELAHQVGWEDYIHVPPPMSEDTIRQGNTHFTESCSPFALSTGSIVQSTREALAELRAAGDTDPRRIIVLMVRGEGPCTIGWYALVQSKVLPEVLRDELDAWGHTIELATVGLDGVGDFVRDMGRLGDERKLHAILRYVDAWEQGLDRLMPWSRWYLQWGLMRSISRLMRILLPKLDAVETLRAEALWRRAHERVRGSITRAYTAGIDLLAHAHTRRDVKRRLVQAQRLLRSVDQDDEPKPRTVVVGEIYVALTSFANRGAIENLLGQQGIEVEEGITLSRFIHHSLQEWKRRARANHPLVRPLVKGLAHLGIRLLGQKPREPGAVPFMTREVGGEGMVSVARARRAVENGVQGILHVFPFKCMPEGLVKDALREISRVYGVRYLAISFDRESDVERLKTELATFAVLLRSDVASACASTEEHDARVSQQLRRQRRQLGAAINRLHAAVERTRILH